jgi:hypothetical protein
MGYQSEAIDCTHKLVGEIVLGAPEDPGPHQRAHSLGREAVTSKQ